MTQARSDQVFSLHLTPMQIPEGMPVTPETVGWSAEGAIAPAGYNLRLLIHPGEPSEMVVQVKNLSSRLLQINLQVEGNFPPNWCRVGTEGSDILPHQQMDAVLYFQIAADFFEQHAVTWSGLPLQLDYTGRIYVYSIEPDTGRRQVDFASFHLHIRPRSLYLDFLPSIYREIDFVGRFLALFEQAFEPAVHTLDSLWAHLDPLTAPQTLLPFLAHWVGWVPPSYIGIERQRYLIRNAMQIYRWRGTRRGLRFYLHLATGLPLDNHLEQENDKHIAIFESFHRGFVLNEARIGRDAMLGGGRPFHFSIHLRPTEATVINEQLVRTVIEQEKPAFCTYDLYIDDAAE